ncbi:MAG: hypothetical protein ACYC3O_13650 [Burkholderiales bacterium]
MYRELAMKQIAFTELRNHAKAFFDLVEAGAAIRILRTVPLISKSSAR